jgi:transposase
MPRNRVSMKKIREVLRLKWSLGLSEREIGLSCNISKGTVSNYLSRAEKAGLSWPLPEKLDDELEQKLFKRSKRSKAERPDVDWAEIHREMQRKGVTLLLLWHDYKLEHPEGYEYSTFTIHYRQWKQSQNLSMRQNHKAGEKLFVDYAGMTLAITNPVTGDIKDAQIFVAVLGASNYSYLEASGSQKIEDWLASHQRALAFFGGVPEIIVPDNLKAGVKSSSYYEPELNVAYAEFAQHYGLAVIPARVRKPQDKAKVEVGVQIVERQVLAPLRDRTFFSLTEANEVLWQNLKTLNEKPFQKRVGSRRSLFEELDQPALRPLPTEVYDLASWKKARVNIDYHIEIEGHYYSVPYHYAREQVDVRLGQNSIEIFSKHKRIASHSRVASFLKHKGRHSTLKEHMPKAHQRYQDWSPQRLISWAGTTGVYTAQLVEHILASRPHPEQGYRSCLGIMRLGKSYSSERLEAACQRACYLQSYSYKSVQSILKNNLDQKPLPQQDTQAEQQTAKQTHQNVRGADYYRKELN